MFVEDCCSLSAILAADIRFVLAASVAWAVRISAVRYLLVLIEDFDIQVASTHGLLRIELRRLDRPPLVLPLKYLPSVWVLDGSFPACVCEVLECFVYQVR